MAPITMNGKSISGTEVRRLFGDNSIGNGQKKVLFKKLYPKFNQQAFDLIVKRTTEAEHARHNPPPPKPPTTLVMS